MATKISNIEKEFILKAAQGEKTPLRIHGNRQMRNCVIAEITRDSLVLEASPDWAGFQSWDKVTGYLDFRGQSIAFKTKVKKVEGRRLHVVLPELACRGLERKYVRVASPYDLDVKFYLQSGEFALNFPVCEEYSAVDLPPYNDTFDVSSMNTLVESFRKRATLFSTDNTTQMFRKRKPVSYEETLISHFGRTLYIPSTQSELPTNDPYPEGRLITKAMEEDFEGTDIFITGSKMEKLLKDKSDNAIHSEIWSPILYYQYVVGYVYMANRNDKRASLDLKAVDLAVEFARILAFFLKSHNYFDDASIRKERTTFGASIVDISASGLLIATPQDSMGVVLRQQSQIELELRFSGKQLRTSARIMRRYSDEKNTFYGLQFTQLTDQQRRDLFEYIYRVEYSPERASAGEAKLLPPSGGA